MNGVFDGTCSGGGRNIMPKGLAFVLEAKKSKLYRKSKKCRINDHKTCKGNRYGHHRGYEKCECPCHTLEMDPNL